jgi:hypothetical protein
MSQWDHDNVVTSEFLRELQTDFKTSGTPTSDDSLRRDFSGGRSASWHASPHVDCLPDRALSVTPPAETVSSRSWLLSLLLEVVCLTFIENQLGVLEWACWWVPCHDTMCSRPLANRCIQIKKLQSLPKHTKISIMNYSDLWHLEPG